MSQRMLSDVCDYQFFVSMSAAFPPPSAISSFLTEHADELASYCLVNYSKLPVLDNLPDDDLYLLVVARYGYSLERIGLAITQIYNPLHNVDVTETETNSGTDTHTYGGTDTSTVTRTSQGVHYEQLMNESLTSGSTFDDTAVANMKPISKTNHDFETQQDTNSLGLSDIEYGKTLDMDYGRQIDKTKKGNIGVMPTQHLIELEYNLRMRLTLFDAIVRACTNTLGSGVWED